jgi:hypothetical protein
MTQCRQKQRDRKALEALTGRALILAWRQDQAFVYPKPRSQGKPQNAGFGFSAM